MYSIHRASGPKNRGRGGRGEGRHPVPVNVGFYACTKWVGTS